MKKSSRKRKAPLKFTPDVRIRDQSTVGKHKSKRKKIKRKTLNNSAQVSSKTDKQSPNLKNNLKQKQLLLNFFKPRPSCPTNNSCSKTKDSKKEQPKCVRRLRSKAPIFELIDEIWVNHCDNLAYVNEESYACKCGVSFCTKSYKRSNFEKHLKRDKRLGKQSLSTLIATSASSKSSVYMRNHGSLDAKTQPQSPLPYQNVCQGFYLRSVDGVDITDKYEVQVGGRDGFYGVPNHRSFIDGELRGTYKSNLCLITGICLDQCDVVVVKSFNLYIFIFHS